MPHQRRQERDDLKRRLLSGASLLMLAPRRIGKTWLLDKVANDMTALGWLCIRVDVQGKRSEDEFLHEVCGAIEKQQGLAKRLFAHVTQRFNQVTSGASTGHLQDMIGKVDARGLLETLVESLAKEDQPTLILIDEIALFVLEIARQNPAQAQSLLYHLRKLQQAHRKVQWFLTGSVGLDVVARRHEIGGALLDYDSVTLDPFSPQASRSYVDALCGEQLVPHPFAFGPGAFAQLVAELGWLSPYHLRQIALLVQPSAAPQSGSPLPVAMPDDISNAVAQLLTPARRMHFAAWAEHIDKNFTAPEAALLSTILGILCRAADGEIEATMLMLLEQDGRTLTTRQLRERLNDLLNDGYLVKVGDRWQFLSALLRRYWQEYMA